MRDEVKVFFGLFARLFAPPEPVVEIGSRQAAGQEGYADLRRLFADRTYVGCDVVPGPGVDRVEDACALGFADGTVGTVISADTLEHVAQPWRALAEMHRVLRPGGLLAVTVPFLFPIHHRPDYFRFSPEGLATLLSPFAEVAVWSLGDAQWPHSVYAVARKAATDGALAADAAALAAAWDAGATHDALLPFVAVDSLVRRDTGGTTLAKIGGGPPVVQDFDCTPARLCRVDVKLDTVGALPTAVTLTLAEASDTARPVARAVAHARIPWAQRWVAFQFPALAESRQKRYRIRLEGDGRIAAHVAPDGTLSFEAFAERVPRPG